MRYVFFFILCILERFFLLCRLSPFMHFGTHFVIPAANSIRWSNIFLNCAFLNTYFWLCILERICVFVSFYIHMNSIYLQEKLSNALYCLSIDSSVLTFDTYILCHAHFNLGWEIRSEFCKILQLFQFRTFWTPEFSSDFFSDRKMCSCQFTTPSCRFGILSHNWFFWFHESEKVPWRQPALSRCTYGGNRHWVDVGMAATGIE